jgi:Carboxypeptidase regulatory-like domain
MNLFSSFLKVAILIVFFGAVGVSAGFAQTTGSIQGRVTDASGALIPGATVTISNAQTGTLRTVTANEDGLYSASALLPADYDVTAEKDGFSKVTQRVTVSAGNDVTVELALSVGSATETVSVEANDLGINLQNNKVDANINPVEVAQLPLIGRSAYELAKLSPAVVITSTPGRNNDISISVIGKSPQSTHVTLNGIDISNYMSGGEPEMNFSQELVQEFQVSLNNGEPTNGASSSGTVNLVTKRGENLYHGSTYGYFRNSQYAGYPGISRPAVIPNPDNNPNIAAVNATNASPNFYRRVFGGLISGPIYKDKAWWLLSAEETQQESAASYSPGFAAFTNAFSSIATIPENRFLPSARLDWQIDPKDTLFLMMPMDRLREVASAAGTPSENGVKNINVYAVILGYTRVFGSNFVGDFRFGGDYYNQVTQNVQAAYDIASQYAAGSGLTTLGSFTAVGTNLTFGGRTDSPQEWWMTRPQFSGNFNYTHKAVTWKFGYIYEPTRFRWYADYSAPMTGTIYNPTQAAAAGISVPSTYNTYSDVLQLPLQSFTFGIGSNLTFPDNWDKNGMLWTQYASFYSGASYRATPKLNLNWALNYSYDGNAPNRDLPLPAGMAALAGGNVQPPRNAKLNFEPQFGFSWDPFGHGKTVIRGGSGLYHGTVALSGWPRARGGLLPVGDGQATVAGTAIMNPKTGVGFLNFPTANSNAAAGVFRLQDLVNAFSGIENNLLSTVFTGTNTNLAVRNFDYFKGDTIPSYVGSFKVPTILQNMIGMEQKLGNDWLVDASFVYDITNHLQFGHDANFNTRPKAFGGPVNPNLGQVVLVDTGGNAIYKGLLASVKKSLSNHYVLTAAYTYQVSEGTVYDAFTPPLLIDYTNRADNYGPIAVIPTQTFSAGATAVNLKWGFDASLVNYMQSSFAFNVYAAGLDFNGDGTTNDHLPEIGYNQINRGCHKGCLATAVAAFNAKYPGTKDTEGTAINPITLPSKYNLGDTLMTQDIRITKNIHLHESMGLKLQAEMFNVLNIANLDYAASAGNVYGTAFGQPTDRNATNFGTGGPRSMQFGAHMEF